MVVTNSLKAHSVELTVNSITAGVVVGKRTVDFIFEVARLLDTSTGLFFFLLFFVELR